jgi:dipeptidyl aminopeptidase/acylaminoacyl peptidase
MDSLADRVAAYFQRMYRPGEDLFHAVISASESPADGTIAFAGPIYRAGGGFPVSLIGLVARDGSFRLLSTGDFSDSEPQWSPDGRQLAFLSDRGRGGGNFQIYIVSSGDFDHPSAGPTLEGEAIESFAWSPDGQRILIQSADSGADAGGSAATATIGSPDAPSAPTWAPDVQDASYANQWRHARVWDAQTGELRTIGEDGQNVWEASWCGNGEVVGLVSAKPTAGGWFETKIAIAPAKGGPFQTLVSPEIQTAKLSGSPDGRYVAFLEGRFYPVVSLGTLTIYDRQTGTQSIPEIGVEVSHHSWLGNDRIFFAGMQMPETVVGTFDLRSGKTREVWRHSGTAGRKVPAAFASRRGWEEGRGSALIPAHSFNHFAHLLRVEEDGSSRVIRDFANAGSAAILEGLEDCQSIWWKGTDGLDIQGYLTLPKGIDNPPLVAFLHGGPCHLFRDSWSFDNLLPSLLVNEGYAILFPNPRGSSGRGVEFASHVLKDFGGRDSEDILAGLDYAIEHFGLDASRQFITGGSYGGYMTCWQVTQGDRFTAAAAVAPLTDMRSFFFTAHHPEFLADYSGASPYEIGGYFDQRSPLRHADKVATPTLLIAGALDRTAPASQAEQFHRALVLRGVPSECAIYPEEGHAAIRYEAMIDQATRILGWFMRWDKDAKAA